MNKEQAREAIRQIRNCILNDKCELINCGYYCSLKNLEELIKYFDSVDEVIHCKNCAYYHEPESRCVLWGMVMDDDFFCGSAEKRIETGSENIEA